MAVRFGLAIDLGARRRTLDRQLARQLRLVRLAERLGFESIWAGESYTQRPDAPGTFHQPDALLMLAALSQHTRLRLGTGVLLLPAWNPLKLAYDVAQLDQLTGGRLVLGVGLGRAPLQRRFGVDPTTVADAADETLLLLRALWAGKDGYAGAHVAAGGAIAPLPAQPGGPPLWVGGSVRRSVERAATYGEAFYASTSYSFEQVARQSARYREALARRGKDPAAAIVSANRLMVVADTEAEARRLGARYAGAVLHAYATLGSLGPERQVRPGTPQTLFEELGDAYCLVGTVEQVAERVRCYAEAGVTHIQARVSPNEMPPEAAARTVRLLGERILPELG